MKTVTKKPRQKIGGQWVFIPDTQKDAPIDKLLEDQRQKEILNIVSVRQHFPGANENPFSAIDEYCDYLPGDNEVPKDGCWILIRKSPPTEYTVPPLSIWFAESWPLEGRGKRPQPHRVKILTPRGELGLWPREYSRVKEVEKYYEFLGAGMEIKFFGSETGVPKDKLFYLRSRGIAKKDAIALLIGSIKAHGVCWIETSREVASCFVREHEFPDPKRLATNLGENAEKAV
jgi:hypothetical protein